MSAAASIDFAAEQQARDAIAQMLDQWDDVGSAKHHRTVAGKIVAHKEFVVSTLTAIGERRDEVQRKQQRTSELSDEDSILERLHHLKSEESYLNACLAAMGSVYAPSLVDRDERGADEDQDRWSREIADEKATNGAPRLAG